MIKIKSDKTAANIAKLLLNINAIKLSPEKPFTWASGIESPIYCDNRKSLSFPDVRTEIVKAFVKKLKMYLPFDLVAGVATGGIAHGALVADKMKKPFIYVRSEKKPHGTGQQIEGQYSYGQTCVVIEDLISTGMSSLQAVKALREEGLVVVVVLSIFTYEFNEAKIAFQNENCRYDSLSNYSTLIKLAYQEGTINDSAAQSLAQWRIDPRKWNKTIE